MDFQRSITYLTLSFIAYWIYKIIYSLFVSPLSKIPGPFIVHFIPGYYKINSLLFGNFHKEVLKLHKKYGTIVRIGGDVISFASEDVAKEIYSTYTYQKGPFYDGFQIAGETVFSSRNKEFHRQRKKALAPSFSEKSIQNVEYLIKQNVINLVQKIQKLIDGENKIDLGVMFHYFSFDVIGDLAFGNSFNMLDKGYHPILSWIKDFFFYSLVVNMFPFMKYFLPKSINKLYEFSNEAIKNSKTQPNRVTILNALINAPHSDSEVKLSEKEIGEESITQIIAGTDTTSNSLAWTFYLLAKHPEVYEKLKAELDSVFTDKDNINYSQCKSQCNYLSAVLYESLRILPVASGNLTRLVPKGGKVIDGYFIPENTVVGVSINSLHNLPQYWDEPDQFKPSRWLDEDGKFKNNKNFMPFLIGPRACLGRTLAWMELYLVTSHLVRNFSFKLNSDKSIDSKLYVVTSPSSPIEVMAFNH